MRSTRQGRWAKAAQEMPLFEPRSGEFGISRR
jgi:hypothetical protein